MSLAIPRFLQARDLYSALVAGGTLNTSGLVDWGTAREMAIRNGSASTTTSATFKAFELRSTPNLVSFIPSDSGIQNLQNEYEDWTVTLREIMPSNGISALMGAFAYDFIRADLAYRPRNASSGGVRIVVVGTRGDYDAGISTGENTNSITIRPCGYDIWVGAIGATPPI